MNRSLPFKDARFEKEEKREKREKRERERRERERGEGEKKEREKREKQKERKKRERGEGEREVVQVLSSCSSCLENIRLSMPQCIRFATRCTSFLNPTFSMQHLFAQAYFLVALLCAQFPFHTDPQPSCYFSCGFLVLLISIVSVVDKEETHKLSVNNQHSCPRIAAMREMISCSICIPLKLNVDKPHSC